MWLLKKLYPQRRSQTSVCQSWIAKHAFTSFILARYAHNINPKHGSMLNTRNEFIRSILKIASGVALRGDSGVAGEGRVVSMPKFHSWGKCTHAINEYQLRLNIQCFLWPMYILYCVMFDQSNHTPRCS